MRDFPPELATDSGGVPIDPEQRPDTRSPSRFLGWLLWQQRDVLVLLILAALLRQLPMAIIPFLLGRVIDTGIAGGDTTALLTWSGWLVGVVVIGTFGIVTHHWLLVKGWLITTYGVIGLVTRRATGLGHVLPRRLPTGEVLSVANSDSEIFGNTLEIFGRFVSSTITFGIVVALMIHTSPPLGIAALIAAPVLLLGATPVLRPMQLAQETERSRASELTGLVTDIVAGLRILRGIGGERTFGDNYAAQSQRVRQAGVRAMSWQAVVESFGVLLSGLLLLMLTWLGAREVLDGRLSIGQLVAFFGYAVFMMVPIAVFFEFAQKWIRGLVSARKTIVLFQQLSPWPEQAPAAGRVDWPNATLHDHRSGVTITPGQLTVLAAAQPDSTAAIADRLGRYLSRDSDPVGEDLGEVTGRRARAAARAERRARRQRLIDRDEDAAKGRWQVTADGIDLSDVPLAEVREHVLVSDAASQVFAGTLQELIDPHGRLSRAEAEEVIRVAAAEDVHLTLAEGWQGRIDERGRGLSGGQRQRLVLARALGIDPDVLILVEPTSAVDAHTEAAIAERLAYFRRDRTTVVVSASPLVLRHADRVVFIEDGEVCGVGTHDELAEGHDLYRRTVLRAFDEEVTDA
ncbi:ABC transporter transmembrane domain-containing protein [Enemella sp. A6]|uniref:ABC transporter transmembrane domain-containing protein n=1 Tax=Enemella sp. A6 TaxID=3440152 RepID=UPI003EB81043